MCDLFKVLSGALKLVTGVWSIQGRSLFEGTHWCTQAVVTDVWSIQGRSLVHSSCSNWCVVYSRARGNQGNTEVGFSVRNIFDELYIFTKKLNKNLCNKHLLYTS